MADDRSDLIQHARAELDRAEQGDDAARLASLDELHRLLESELEQAFPPGR